MNHAVDLFDLLTEAKSRLSTKAVPLSTLTEQQISDLFSNRVIEWSEAVEDYFSPLDLHDAKEDVHYPFLFLKTDILKDGGHVLLSKKGEKVLLNPLAVPVLSDIGIDLSESKVRQGDLNSYRLTVAAQIALHDPEHRFSLKPVLTFHDTNTILFAQVYDDLADLLSASHRDMRFRGLFSKALSPEEQGDSAGKDVRSVLYRRFDALLSDLKEKKAVKGTYGDREGLRFFVGYLIQRLAQNGKTILFLSGKGDGVPKDLIEENGLGDFMWHVGDIQASSVPKERRLDHDRVDIAENTIALERYGALRQDYKKFDSARKKAFRLVRQGVRLIDQGRLVHALESGLKPTSLALDDYTLADLEKDLVFLDAIEGLETLKKTVLPSCMYHGLTVSGTKENYDRLEDLLNAILRGLDVFEKTLQEERLADFQGNEIRTLQAFEDVGKNIQILSGYTGFPKKYFTIKTDRDELERLKKLYQCNSSIRLLLGNLFGEEIFQKNLPLLFGRLSSRNPLLRKKATFTLRRLSKKTWNGKERETVCYLLKTYIDSSKELQDKIDFYARIYGESVRTMNGVIELESNADYVRSFFNRAERDKTFSMESPAIKKGLRDRSYVHKLEQSYHVVDSVYQPLKKDINLYIGFFLEDRRNFMSYSIDELKTFFSSKKSGPFDLFKEYATFSKAAESISLPMAQAVRRRSLSGQTLENLYDSFLLSVLKSLYDKAEKDFEGMEEGYRASKKKYLSQMVDHRSYCKERIRLALETERKKALDSPRFQDSYQRLLLQIEHGEDIDSAVLYGTLSRIDPLFQARNDDLPLLQKDMADVLVLFHSSSLSDVALIKAVLSAKHILFLEEGSMADLRLVGYDDFRLDRTSLYYAYYRQNLSDTAKLELGKKMASFNATLLLPGTDFPSEILFQDGTTNALFFDIFIPDDVADETYLDLREYLSVAYKKDVVDLDTVNLYIHPRKAMEDGFLQRKKEPPLSGDSSKDDSFPV